MKKFLSLRGRAFAAASLSALLTVAATAGMSDQVKQQIAQVESLKARFTVAQRKLDSNLVFGALAARGQLPTTLAGMGLDDRLPKTSAGVVTNGLVAVEIHGNLSTSLVAYLKSLGGIITSTDTRQGVMLAKLPIAKADTLALHGDLKSMTLEPMKDTSRVNLDSPGLAGFNSLVGALTSQGYVAHGANVAYSHGYTGSGVKVGVLSDSASATRVAALIASGDLPGSTTVLTGQDGSGNDEGTAMMEIVHDLAPGAQLYFATAFTSAASFASNIIALKDAGCKVIVDDVSYYNEGVFQDGPIAQAVNTVTAAGVSYFSSAGNSGNETLGTAGAWEGDFVDGGAVASPITGTGRVHSFGSQNYNKLGTVITLINLKWSDPLGASSNDYDLYVLNAAGTSILASGVTTQSGTQDPYEYAYRSSGFPLNSQIYIVKKSTAATRALHLDTNRGTLQFHTPGVVYGHNAAKSTITTAATYWNSAKTGVKAFTGFANPVESFSSDGPRRIFFNPDGTAITAGNFLFSTTGGTLLSKPDITAADGVSTKTPGFLPFFGTSAAAPHAAALAALVLQARPSYTPAQVKAALQNSALDTMAVGFDRDSGSGIAMAWPAVQYAIAHP